MKLKFPFNTMQNTKNTPKVAICLALPQWLLDRLADQKIETHQSRAVIIEKALCNHYGWANDNGRQTK